MLGNECPVVADEHSAAAADRYPKAPVLAVTKPQHILVPRVGVPQGQDAEEAQPILCAAVVLGGDLVAIRPQRS